jgi:hypothetical protein
MNIALEQTEEHVNGTVTNRYGDAFIRGNNGPTVPVALLPADVFTHAQYSTYQLLNPYKSLSFALAVKLHSDLNNLSAPQIQCLGVSFERLLGRSLRASGPRSEARYLQTVNMSTSEKRP